MYFIEGSLEVKLPTISIWTDEKQSRAEAGADHFWQLRCRKSARRCGAKTHFQVKMYKALGVRITFGSWDVEKVHARKHISKSKCTKHQGCGPLLAVEMSKKCTPLWREAHFEVKMYKTDHVRTTFGSCDVEKVHAVVARSTFPSQNVRNTPLSDHFWKLKHQGFGPLLEVRMSKKCMPLWREAHFEVKMFKTLGVRTTFGGSDVASLHYTTLHYTTLHSTTLHYRTLHYTTLQYTTLHYTTLQYTPLH